VRDFVPDDLEATVRLEAADIAHVARAVAQALFGRSLDTGVRAGPSTGDYLETFGRTRPMVTEEMAREFAGHTVRYGRT
jgi:transitional endoplasmic reticulum ATPase